MWQNINSVMIAVVGFYFGGKAVEKASDVVREDGSRQTIYQGCDEFCSGEREHFLAGRRRSSPGHCLLAAWSWRNATPPRDLGDRPALDEGMSASSRTARHAARNSLRDALG